MRRALAWIAAASCIAAAAGCERFGANAAADARAVAIPGLEALPAESDELVALVNGRPVTGAMVELYSASRHEQHPAGKPPQPRELANELINMELLAEDAARAGLDRRPDIATALYFQRTNLLAGAMMEELARNAHIDEAQVRQRYAEQYPNATITEYRTRQILVDDRKQAEQLIAQLRAGGSFAALARQHSKGPAAAQGGALDWFRASQVLPEFATATAALQTGEFTRTPVHTTYGWHVILLEDQRHVAAPDFVHAQPDILRALVTERIERKLDELRANAAIEYKRP